MTTQDYLKSHRFYEPFATTIAGFIVPIISGLVSASSSALLFYVIFKSGIKFSSTYHRIMALMSCSDIISSIFIALGTIMMPKDNIYPFKGPMLGNKSTCQMQGWIIMFGVSGNTCLNACLCWYFVCKITLKMNAERIARYVEPIFFTIVSLISLFFPSFYVAKDLFHPNVYDNFCTVIPYPKSCDDTKWYDWNACEWGDGILQNYFTNLRYLEIIVTIIFALVVLGVVIILWTVFRTNRSIENLISATLHEKSQVMAWDEERKRIYDSEIHELSNLKYSRILIYQALMYVAAFLSTWLLNMLSGSFHLASFWLDAVNCVLFPLQGFWNLFIFLIDKTYLIRLNQRDRITFGQAVLKLLKAPEEAPVFALSNISMVEIENDGTLPIAKYYATEDLPSESTPGESPLLDPEYDDLSDLRNVESVLDSNSREIESQDLSSKVSFLSRKSHTSERHYQNTRSSVVNSNKCYWVPQSQE